MCGINKQQCRRKEKGNRKRKKRRQGSTVTPLLLASGGAWMESYNLTLRSAEDDGEHRQSHRDEGHVSPRKDHPRLDFKPSNFKEQVFSSVCTSRKRRANGRSRALSWPGNSTGDGTALTVRNLSVEMTERCCDAAHPGRGVCCLHGTTETLELCPITRPSTVTNNKNQTASPV